MMGWVLEQKDQMKFWLALTPWEAKTMCKFKFWKAEKGTLKRKTKDWCSKQKGIEGASSPMKDWLSRKFHSLGGLVMLSVLFLDVYEVVVSSQLTFFFTWVTLKGFLLILTFTIPPQLTCLTSLSKVFKSFLISRIIFPKFLGKIFPCSVSQVPLA